MTPKTEARLKGFTGHFGLPVVYSTDLPDKVLGMLVPDGDSSTIVLNANRPALDHAFTIAHEIGHYIMHKDGKREFPLPLFLSRRWKWRPVRIIARKARAIMAEKVDKEWEADFWAFVMLWHIAAVPELKFVFECYPEKRMLLWLSIFAVAVGIGRHLEKNQRRKIGRPNGCWGIVSLPSWIGAASRQTRVKA
jgi:hypothetical protein